MAKDKDINDLAGIKSERERLTNVINLKQKTINRTEEIDPDTPTGTRFDTVKDAEGFDQQLKNFNEKYAFINSYGGKPAIKKLIYNEYFSKEVIEFIAPESFAVIHNNDIYIDGMKNNLPLGKWWLQNKHRKTYDTVTFEPDKKPGEYVSENGNSMYFNLWEGFAVESKKGSWKYTKKHIYEIFCNKDIEKFKYVMRWFAWAVQNPGKQAEVALIFKGKKGAGKSLILKSIMNLFGRHGLPISQPEHLTGKHNDHLSMCSFLFLDEAFKPSNKETEGVLKSLITEGSLTTEPKFRGIKITKNCLHIVMATNADWVVPATEDERRFFINEVDSKYSMGSCTEEKRIKYFSRISQELKEDGLSAMLYDFQKMDLTNWHPRNSVPRTDELKRQIQMSLPKLKYAFLNLLEDGVFPGNINDKQQYEISSMGLLEHIQKLDPSNKSITAKSLATLCKDLGVLTTRTSKFRGYIFPELIEARKFWDERLGKNPDWDDSSKWMVISTHLVTPY